MTVHGVRAIYIICDLIGSFVLLGLAIVTPIYVTPGYYWWTVFCLLCLMSESISFANRLNTWGDMGKAGE